MSMNKFLVALLSALTLLSTPACAQRKVVSDYNYRKAVEAYFEDDDDERLSTCSTNRLTRLPTI